MSDHQPVHLTGRGGFGNAGKDAGIEYTDAGIKREGALGISPEGEYSSGRGGAGNIVESPKVGPIDGRRGSQDIIPEQSIVEGHENFHTGRGGGGNVHKEKYGGHTHDPNKPSIIEKAKELLTGHHKEKKVEKVDGAVPSTGL